MEVLDLKAGGWVLTQNTIGGPVSVPGVGGGFVYVGHYGQRSLTLPDGAFFSCGGYEGSNGTTEVGVLYWPSAVGNGSQGTAQFTGGAMACPRDRHSVNLLYLGFAQGLVVVIGGERDDYVFAPICMDTAEVYDHSLTTQTPYLNGTQGDFTPVAGPMFFKRADHTANLLKSGKILVTGGWKVSPYLAPNHHGSQERTTELFDPFALGTNITNPYAGIDITGKFDWTRNPQGNQTAMPNLFTGVAQHRAFNLKDGRVLICGGIDLRPQGNPPGWAGFPFAPPTGWPTHVVTTNVCSIYNP
jgi:hypothetical protein